MVGGGSSIKWSYIKQLRNSLGGGGGGGGGGSTQNSSQVNFGATNFATFGWKNFLGIVK